jgi:hypothetical protein
LIMIVSAARFIGVIVSREAIRFKRQGWRFSLRTMLIVMTAIAYAFGMIALLRYLSSTP